MQSNDRKKMIQQGFDTVAEGYDHPSLSFFPETAKTPGRTPPAKPNRPPARRLHRQRGINRQRRKSLMFPFFTFHFLSPWTECMLRIVRNDSSAFFIVLSCWDVVFYGRPPWMVAYMDIGGRATQDAVAGRRQLAECIRGGGHYWSSCTGSKIERISAANRANYVEKFANQMSEEEQRV